MYGGLSVNTVTWLLLVTPTMEFHLVNDYLFIFLFPPLMPYLCITLLKLITTSWVFINTFWKASLKLPFMIFGQKHM